MKKFFSLIGLSLVLAACGTGGGATETTRTPKGNPNAAVVVLEFADLQCPACRAAHAQITTPLLEQYGNDIVFHYKHFPLQSIHRYALEAAMASECAADQGKFWEFVDLDYTNQDSLNSDALRTWAEELGLDVATFDKCIKTNDKRNIVLADYKEGRDLGVGGTPTYYVNGTRVDSGFDTLSAAIEAELGRLTQQL